MPEISCGRGSRYCLPVRCTPPPQPHTHRRISVTPVGPDFPEILAFLVLVNMLGEINADSHFLYHAELGFQPVDMFFFVDENLFE